VQPPEGGRGGGMGLLTPRAKGELMRQLGKLANLERNFSEDDTPENRALAQQLLAQTTYCLELFDEMEARFSRRFNKRDRNQLEAEWAPMRLGLEERRGFYTLMSGELESS
jgi:hypothetical protein